MKNSVVLITGGGTGIGATTAHLFAGEGASVCLVGRRREPLDEAVKAVRKLGGQALAITGDVGVTEDCERIVDRVLSRFGKIDVLVNNAGVATLASTEDTTDELWENTIQTNLTGAFRLIRAALPEMVSRRSGCIVNVSSVLAQSGMKGALAYGASKAGLEQLTRVLAIEYADRGIRANAVAPAWVDTPMTKSIQVHKQFYDYLKKRHPMGRFGTTREVAQAILYLASNESAWITGTILAVDGGWAAT